MHTVVGFGDCTEQFFSFVSRPTLVSWTKACLCCPAPVCLLKLQSQRQAGGQHWRACVGAIAAARAHSHAARFDGATPLALPLIGRRHSPRPPVSCSSFAPILLFRPPAAGWPRRSNWRTNHLIGLQSSRLGAGQPGTGRAWRWAQKIDAWRHLLLGHNGRRRERGATLAVQVQVR